MKENLPPDILELQLRLGQDDQSALRSLYDHFGAKLLQLALAIIQSRETAEEIVEDVFVQVWNKRARISSLENLTWYLYVITRNISLNYYRKAKNRKREITGEWAAGHYQVSATPEQILISREAIERINEAINELPGQCRLIFKLVKEDNLKYREVAELLQIKVKTVENQVGIALKKIYSSIPDHTPHSIRFFR